MDTFKKSLIARFYVILLISGLLCSNIASAETFSTSFEFSNSGTFSIGEEPFTATFSGGNAQTLGNAAYYHSGLFSWHVPSGGMANVSFETPVDSVDFWVRDTVNPDIGGGGGGIYAADTHAIASGSYRIYDTDDTIIASGSASQSFVNVLQSRTGSETRIARLEFDGAGDADSVVDDFTYMVTEPGPEPDEAINVKLQEPRDDSIYSGIGNLRGFALSIDGIERVELYVDGKYKGDIPYGGSRRDVGEKNPEIPNSNDSGFSQAFNYNNLALGEHTITARAIAKNGEFNESSGAFTVQKFHKSFFSDSNAIDLSDSLVDKDDAGIIIQNLSVESRLYDVRLQWNTQTQGFEIVEIR